MNGIRKKCQAMWCGMRRRCLTDKSYRDVRICMSKIEFIAWAEFRVRNYLYFNPGRTPSVDRIDPDGDYEFQNMRIISVEENRSRSRFIFRFLRLENLVHKEKIRVLAESVLSTCRNAGIDRNEFVTHLRDKM